MNLVEQIRTYITENLIFDKSIKFGNDDSFIREGLIDSMGVMELVGYVSSQFGITVEQDDVIPDNFDSVNKLVAFINRKTGSSQSSTYANPGRARAQRQVSSR
ncbi:MAG: acyl carrier protein [Acidobacteriaceae bacterium]|nr:acyl carrier protein [Acidobacteriaceae bacterium]